MTTSIVDERAPLIPKRQRQQQRQQGDDITDLKSTKVQRTARQIFSVENRILFAGFFITLAFSYTQVPYVPIFVR